MTVRRPGRSARLAVIVCLAAPSGACEASFQDFQGLPPLDADEGPAVEVDAGSVPDLGILGDAAAALPDSGSGARDDAGGDGGLIATGRWEGRTGYRASGSVSLIRTAAGDLELVFGDDFDSQAVPGPIVVLSRRERLGRGAPDEAEGDVSLGVLQAVDGGQTYPVPPGHGDARYAWVYCFPFQVEVARARLEEAP
ncbi:MAG: hypothetical protein ACFCGT_16545 [Sandaracinaceae bacterium]